MKVNVTMTEHKTVDIDKTALINQIRKDLLKDCSVIDGNLKAYKKINLTEYDWVLLRQATESEIEIEQALQTLQKHL